MLRGRLGLQSRSPNASNTNNVRNVNSDGTLNNNNANNGNNGVRPDSAKPLKKEGSKVKGGLTDGHETP